MHRYGLSLCVPVVSARRRLIHELESVSVMGDISETGCGGAVTGIRVRDGDTSAYRLEAEAH